MRIDFNGIVNSDNGVELATSRVGQSFIVSADFGDWATENLSVKPVRVEFMAAVCQTHFGSAVWRRLCKIYGGAADIESMTAYKRSCVFTRAFLTLATALSDELRSKIEKATKRNIALRREEQIEGRDAMTDAIASLKHNALVEAVTSAFDSYCPNNRFHNMDAFFPGRNGDEEANRAKHGLASAIIGVWLFKDANTRSLRNLHYVLTGKWPG